MSLMNIIILGFGKVGSEIQKICQKNQIPIKAIVSPNNRIATHKNIADVEIKKGDTVIDFSHPDAVIQNTKTVAASGANIVVGTTGWGKNRESILNIISNSDIGFAYTPNYLPEVHTFWSTIRFLVEEMEAGNNNYSAKIFEIRLATKNTPSGTAKKTAEILCGKKNIQFDINNDFQCSYTGEKALDIHIDISSDSGNFALHYESDDVLTNNKIYALMAIKTTFWLQKKKGFYELDTKMIQEIKNISL
jgi:4-hydroxy-tetrahydrodipicolinate reductase